MTLTGLIASEGCDMIIFEDTVITPTAGGFRKPAPQKGRLNHPQGVLVERMSKTGLKGWWWVQKTSQ